MAAGAAAKACMNGFGETFTHALEDSRRQYPVPLGHPIDFTGNEKNEMIYTSKDGYARKQFKESIDYGLYLVYDQQYEEAEKVFRNIIQTWPDRYEAASNLGTILEVNGKNAEALKWIKKAIKIDPESHEGSEWLHVKILEAKLGGKNKWTGASITGTDFGREDVPASNLDVQALKTLQKHLFFQLNERVTFIPPKEPYIAALLFELGNVTLALGDSESALSIYKKAKKYGFQQPLIDARMKLAGFSRPGEATLADSAGPDSPAARTTPQASPSTAPGVPVAAAPGNPVMFILLLSVIAALVTFFIFLARKVRS